MLPLQVRCPFNAALPREGPMRTGVLLSVLAGVALAAGAARAQCGQAFDFANFSSVTDLNLVSQA
ncbi:MAG: hypothetical protein ACK58T_41470, partial [Phycisphaerae bacterium]